MMLFGAFLNLRKKWPQVLGKFASGYRNGQEVFNGSGLRLWDLQLAVWALRLLRSLAT